MHFPMICSSFKMIIRFFLKLLLIASVILVCDRGVGTILKLFYFRMESGENYRTTYSIDSTTADILVFGSSRANHNYVPDIFEDKLHNTFYNTGRDGNYVLYNYAIFKAITGRYNPRLIIIDIRPEELAYSAIEYYRLASLLPYYQSHPEIRRIVDYRSAFEKVKHVSAIYPYNSLILRIAMGNLKYSDKEEPSTKGYVPIVKIMKNKTIDTLKINAFIIDENKILALKDIISICKRKNIELVFVFSPVWSIIQNTFCSSIISDLCYENGIRYVDMSNHETFISNPRYFADISHLNDEGARVFSTILATTQIERKIFELNPQ